MTAWVQRREAWVRTVGAEELLTVIAAVASAADLDENGGDSKERADTVLWLASRGARGREWGHAASAADEVSHPPV